MKRLFFLGGLLLTVVVLEAQTGQHKFRQLSIKEGLSHNQVTAIHKDKTGFVWIGTAIGLNRFDGLVVKVFRRDSRDTTTLPHNQIQRILEAPDGRLVVMTAGGAATFDPSTETFTRNTRRLYLDYGLPAGELVDILSDSRGMYWFVMAESLIVYDPGTRKSTVINTNNETDIPASITSFLEVSEGQFWVMYANGVLERLALSNDQRWEVAFRSMHLTSTNSGGVFDYKFYADKVGDLWIWLNNDNRGVFRFETRANKFTHYTASPGSPVRLNTNIATGIIEDNKGMMWVGTDHGGINVIDPASGTVSYVYHREQDATALAHNSVTALYKDYNGIIWAGTYKSGVSYYHESIFQFPLFSAVTTDSKSLPHADVNRFVEDRAGNIWIGTNGGGLIRYDRRSGAFTQFINDPGDPSSLSSNVIVSLFIDHENILWIGTYYGGLNRYENGKFRRYGYNANDQRSLPGRSVWEIFEDSNNRLWIGTLEAGLCEYIRKDDGFSRFGELADGKNTISTYISAITEVDNGDLWIGTDAGITRYSPQTGQVSMFVNDPLSRSSLANNYVFDILQDSRKRIWIATQEGLNLFLPATGNFTTLHLNGLPDNSAVLTIEEDSSGDLWLGTLRGLLRVRFLGSNTDSLIVDTFTDDDGLQGLQFNENASYRTREGELIFGGPNGFNLFDPANIRSVHWDPSIVFTDFQLFQRSVEIGEEVNGRVILNQAITRTSQIVLPPGQNFFSIEFSALDFLHPDKGEYVYRLDGLHSEWLPIDKGTRKLTFTNLSSRKYKLHLAVVTGRNEPQPAASLEIELLPPFYKTNAAFAFYLLFLLGVLVTARKLIQQREKLKFAIEQERQEAIRMHELDMMKIRFFTNVSHEFRTPLTLILTPLERLLKQSQDSPHSATYQLIHRNAKRLLTLVNQLLDFRKMEVQELRFLPSEGDVISFIRDTVFSFSDLSEKKGIDLKLTVALDHLETLFDQDKLEKILFNLLSNAFKFTPGGGEVSVDVSLPEGEETILVIRVCDTGIGIPIDKQSRIFDRFFQHELPRSVVNQGSGIGLSITKEFVRICGGEVSVESEPDKGSCFTVRLPVSRIQVPLTSPDVQSAYLAEPRVDENAVEKESKDGAPALLLIEDNDDFRFYLKDNLKLHYRIIEASDGESGWKQCLEMQPDLIVSDVMMPGISGIELCRRIKTDERVSHIPVILLTARNSDEQRLEGFQTGADDYITKPFNFEILESRIKNLVSMRERAQKVFRKTLDVKASELNITPLDSKLIENAIKCVEQNVSSPEFSVEELGKQLGFSRAYLYKKIVALTGKSPLEFIRTIRLQHAAQLLEKSQLTVAEVAYRVGFNNPKYFARYFKEEFKVLPSSYAASKKGKKSS